MGFHDIGRRLVSARKRLGWSQQTLAKRANVSRSTVSSAELSYHSTTIQTIEQLADAMGVDVEFILAGEQSAATASEPNPPAYGDGPCPCMIHNYHLTPSEALALDRFLGHIQRSRKATP